MARHAVSSLVNKPANDVAECIAAVADEEPGAGQLELFGDS